MLIGATKDLGSSHVRLGAWAWEGTAEMLRCAQHDRD